MKNFNMKLFILIIVMLSMSGCYYKYTGANSTLDRRVHIFAVRQSPLPPTYNRIRTVHLAEPLPSRDNHPVSNRIITPVFQFEAENSTFDEVALILANTAKYSAHCDPGIANKKVSSRIESVAKSLGIENQIIYDIESFEWNDIQFNNYRKELNQFTEYSKQFLSNALK